MIKEMIIRDFRDRDRKPMVAIDFDKTVAPLLESDTLTYVQAAGDDIASVAEEVEKRHNEQRNLKEVGKIVFELSVNPEKGDLTVAELASLSTLFSSLPQHPDILWGCSHTTAQPARIALNLLSV